MLCAAQAMPRAPLSLLSQMLSLPMARIARNASVAVSASFLVAGCVSAVIAIYGNTGDRSLQGKQTSALVLASLIAPAAGVPFLAAANNLSDQVDRHTIA